MTPMTFVPMAFALLALSVLASSAGVQTGAVRVTQRHMAALCLDGRTIAAGARKWTLGAGTHTMAFTMRNQPRAGRATEGGTAPDVATVSFAVEAGHKYEVEIRAEAVSFSTRIWARDEWRPVVRDRTADRIVSGDPQWRDVEGSCATEP